MLNNSIYPLSEDQLKLVAELSGSLSNEQSYWISGYFAGLTAQKPSSSSTIYQELNVNATGTSLTVLYGSRTGNGEGIAKKIVKTASELGINAKLKSMESYKNNDLKAETNLLVIISTHGEGEPPFQAKSFYDFLYSKRAPQLDKVKFSVLALGDSSYLKFCQTGKEFDKRFEELGAKRIYERVDCDVNFHDAADKWISETLKSFGSEKVGSFTSNLVPKLENDGVENLYNKQNPFLAPVLEKTFLHGRTSDRQTLHVELSLENSGLSYEPGDSLGVFATNPPQLVDRLIQTVQLSPTDSVTTAKGKISLHETLFSNYELTQLTPDVLNRFAKLTDNKEIKNILAQPELIKDFIYGKDLVDLFTTFPEKLDVDQFISVLRPIQPRLYSISSSPLAYPDEVHLTVGVVKYKSGDRDKTGLCSVFLSDRMEENEGAPVFVEKNNNFRLPENAETPIIMVGAGTGIAPYRAFVQHREMQEKRGKSWLIFGNRHSESEFLYQLEWQRQLREGTLTRMDVAFSRDTKERVYVQHKIEEQGKLLYDWLENGAHFYVCGDMKKMARDVHSSLVDIVSKFGGVSKDAAEEYLVKLQQERRYQTDVY